MEIVYSLDGLQDYLDRVGAAHGSGKEIFLDRFLEDSIEVDVDALCDGEDVWIGGIMQHVEEAGIHSGDSACVLPPHSLGAEALAQISAHTAGIAKALGVVGLINIQYAVGKDGTLYVIEANPRASRTVPFVSKAIGLPLAKLACRIMLGEKIADLDLPEDPVGDVVCVKEAVMPFDRFAGADSLLGPEMRSTGEVMGIAQDFPTAFAKAQAAAGSVLPSEGTVFISVTDGDKPAAAGVAMALHGLGFRILATRRHRQRDQADGHPGAGAEEDRRGLAERQRADRAGRGPAGRQHAARDRRARRRLGDPLRRDRRRRALHHDDDRRDGGGAGDRRRQPHDAVGDLAAAAPAGRSGGRPPPEAGRRGGPTRLADYRPRPRRRCTHACSADATE